MSVLVLNSNREPLHTVSVPHAIRMLIRDVAEVHVHDPDVCFGAFPLPREVRLHRYVVMTWRYERALRWSRRGVLIRDGHTCGYCGAYADTVDHILPTSRGGERASWLNTVACCGGTSRSCNARKGDRKPEEAGLRLQRKPFVPSWHQIYGNVA